LNQRVVVIGGSGHAKVLVDILEQTADIEIVGFVSIDEHDTLYGYPRLGNDDALPAVFDSGVRSALVAIGDNRRRKLSIDTLVSRGFKLIDAISPAAVVSKYARLGRGIAVLPGAVVNAHAVLGDGVVVNTNASIDHDCVIGPYVHIAPGANVAGCVRIDEGVLLGTGSSVIPGVTIGSWTVVGAGAAVVSDLPANVVAVGVPARLSNVNRADE
jgi:sugar O-acyltransferase (sialic acid O-acetyltransferase NeuD family)